MILTILLVIITFIFVEGHSSVNQISLESSLQNKQKEEIQHTKISNKFQSNQNFSFYISSNDVCKSTISQFDSGDYKSIKDALNQTCSEIQGYQIILLDSIHSEFLLINHNSSIQISGNNAIQTIWNVNQICSMTLNIQQGNITLNNIKFQFTNIGGPDQIITTQSVLVQCASQTLYPSLTIQNCNFHSIQGNFNESFHFLTQNSNKIQIDNCTFTGIGTDILSNISMISATQFNQIILKSCKFSDVSISQEQGAVFLFAEFNNSSILVQLCEFHNILSSNTMSSSALYIQGDSGILVNISGNLFSNCQTDDSFSGALMIANDNEQGLIEYIINNNTFTNNQGQFSGGIFLNTVYQFASFNFNNNQFANNLNNQSTGKGQDAYLQFTDPPAEWTNETIKGIITEIFKGSTSDGSKGTVFYLISDSSKVVHDFEGNITLPKTFNQKKSINIYILIGIIVASVAILASIITIIMIIVIIYKKKSKYKSSLQERQNLIIRTSTRSA